ETCSSQPSVLGDADGASKITHPLLLSLASMLRRAGDPWDPRSREGCIVCWLVATGASTIPCGEIPGGGSHRQRIYPPARRRGAAPGGRGRSAVHCLLDRVGRAGRYTAS